MYRDKIDESLHLLGLSIVFIGFLCFLVYQFFSPTVATKKLVDEWAVTLDAKVGPDGTYDRWPTVELPAVDSWKHALRVEYNQGVVESVLVRSAGSDGQFGTEDDITAKKRNLVPGAIKKVVNQEFEDTAHSIGKGGAKGLIEGIKEALSKKEPQKK